MNKEGLTTMNDAIEYGAAQTVQNMQPVERPGYLIGKYFICLQPLNTLERQHIAKCGKVIAYLGNEKYYVEHINRSLRPIGGRIMSLSAMMELNATFFTEEQIKERVNYAYELD